MNQNKYYTPTLDEFHIGFEYEHSLIGHDNWMKNCVDAEYDLDFIDGTTYIAVGNTYNEYRVKYLDHDDLVELGWTQVYLLKKGPKKEDSSHAIYETKNGDINYKLYIDLDQGVKEIGIYQPRRKEMSLRLFQGHISNKSELRRLMSQLGFYLENS